LGPLAIYISVIVVLIALSIAVRIWRHHPTRKCHLCGAQVELGRARCQVCNYRFQD
jgi:hypothetical protein